MKENDYRYEKKEIQVGRSGKKYLHIKKLSPLGILQGEKQIPHQSLF